MSMTLSEELAWRGFVNQTTFSDLKELDKKKLKFYHGFDASSDSQTVGNLAAMMMDKVFMRHGYQAVLLAGGATSLIGDPGGKDKERILQDENTIGENVKKAELQLRKVFSGQKFTLVNNLDWYKEMNVLHFLRDVGKHFSMTPLVQRDYIANRMGEGGSGISYTEFSYTILQGYDFWHLFKNYGVQLQLAGSDQWGNSISGVDLIRRTEAAETHVFTCPLIINKATGKKFGKSEDGAVWLDADKTPVADFYQFWLNADDEGVEGYLKVYTELDKPAIEKVMTEFNADRSKRFAQKTLAEEITKLVHGKEQAEKAKQHAETLFESPNTSISADTEIKAGDKIIDVLAATGLVGSKSEARKVLESGGVYINDTQIDKEVFENSDAKDGVIKLRRGKKLQNTVFLRLK